MQPFLLKIQAIYNLWLKQWAIETSEEKQNIVSFLVRIGTVLLLYVFLDKVLMKVTNLPLIAYQKPFLYLAFLQNLLTSWHLVFLIIFFAFLLIFHKNLLCAWSDFPKGKLVRFVVLISAGLLTWIFITYNYNLYFNHGHYFDRLLLFIFLLLIYWRPIFVLPFLTILLPIIWQFTAFPGFSFASPFLPIRILILFSSFFLIYLIVKKLPISDFVFLCGCLLITHYWVSGYAKLSFDWILNDQLYFLMPATYANGWLGFLDSQTISSITQKLSYFNFPIKILTLFFEVGAMFFFFHRHTPKLFLFGLAFFHLGVFFVSGIFFWVWILIDIAFLYLFFKKDGFSSLPIFNFKYLIVSIILIVSGSFWCKPVLLAWFDVPVSYTYRFEATTEDGNTFQLPPKFFSPFDYQFTLGSFSYLDQKPILPIVWGATGNKTGVKIMKLASNQSLFSFEKTNGKVYLNENSKKAFNSFIKQYIQNWNKRFSNETYLSYIEAPRLLWTFPTSIDFKKPNQTIKHIKVIQVMSFYNKGKYAEIRKKTVNEISID